MDGYDVVTVDDEKVGKVVETSNGYLIIEHGMVRKSKRALPREFAHVDESEQQVRISVSKNVFLDSPEVDEEPNEQAVAEYYGLVPSTGPGTEGYGESVEGDPARSSEEQAMRDDVPSAAEERARIQGGDSSSGLPQESPALLGDRLAGVDERQE